MKEENLKLELNVQGHYYKLSFLKKRKIKKMMMMKMKKRRRKRIVKRKRMKRKPKLKMKKRKKDLIPQIFADECGVTLLHY